MASDTNAFLAVVLSERERDWVIEKASRYSIVSPEVLPYEIGNALIALRKKKRLNDREILRALYLCQRTTVKLVEI